MAYFSDAWDAGAIIVLNMNTRTSRRFAGPATANDPSYSMVINGKNYGKHIFTTPTDGIAITADKNALFFCQVQGTTLYRVPTAVLQDDSTPEDSDPNAAFNAAVQVLGTKEPSDGMKYIGDTLYWGALTQSTLYSMRVNATSAVADMETEAQPWVAQDADTMQWVSEWCCVRASSDVFNLLVCCTFLPPCFACCYSWIRSPSTCPPAPRETAWTRLPCTS